MDKKKYEATGASGGNYIDDTVNDSNGCAFVVDYDKKTKRISAGKSMNFPLNQFVKKGMPTGEVIMPSMESACVAVNGPSGSEHIFIAGTLYSYNGASLGAVHTADKFTKNPVIGNKAWVADIAVGNFTGNQAGREQVIYSAGYQKYDASTEKYYDINIMGGDGYSGQGIVSSYFDRHNKEGEYEVAGATDYTTYLTLTSAEPDNDSIKGKFSSKDYGFADAEIQAILMAAPYYEDIGKKDENYLEGCSTSYGTMQGTGDTETSTHNENFEFFVGIEVDTDLYEMSKKAGYTQQFTREWEDSMEQSVSYEFTGGTSEHSVVLSRTPVIFYKYDVYEPKDGTWKNMVVGVPDGGKSRIIMGIDDYNASVPFYNESLTNEGKKLPLITDEMLYHVEPGKPDTYLNAVPGTAQGTAVVSDSISLGQGINSVTVSIGKGTSKSFTETYTNGFTIETEHFFGGGFLGQSAKLGFGGSIGGDFGTGKTKTDFGELTSTGQVRNLPSGTNAAFYGFNWKFATWSVDLPTTIGDTPAKTTIPMLAYLVNNARSQLNGPKDLTATTMSESSVKLDWSPVSPVLDGSITYSVYLGEEPKADNLIAANVTDTNYTVENLTPNKDYTFCVRTVEDGRQGLYSTVSTSTMKKYCSIQVSPNQSYMMDGFSIVRRDTGVEINPVTDTVIQGTTIDVSITPREGYALTSCEVINNGVSTQVPCGGVDVTKFSVPLNGDVQIVPNFEKQTAVVTYEIRSTEQGVISAKTSDGLPITSGATVKKSIVFTVVPVEGYRVKEWKVNGTVQAGEKGNTFTLPLRESSLNVEAVMEPVPSHSITVNEMTNGTLLVKDEEGEVITDLTNIKGGTILTFEAIPAKGYELEYWTDALSSYGYASPIKVTVNEDMTIGAVFESVATSYPFEYSSLNKKGGTVSARNNGVNIEEELSSVIGGTDTITVTATPNAPYVLKNWILNNEVLDTRELTLSVPEITGSTTVQADFYIPLSIDTQECVAGEKERAYRQIIQLSGEYDDITISQGKLPAGLDLTGNEISGTPTEEGEFTFTLESSNTEETVTKEFTISIVTAVIEVTGITKTPTEIYQGESLKLTGTVKPTDATYKNIVWGIDESVDGITLKGDVLTVDSDFAQDTIEVTATIFQGSAADYKQTVTLDVLEFIPVTDITLSTLKGSTGGSFDVSKAVLEPEDATNKDILWSIGPKNQLLGVTQIDETTFDFQKAGTAALRATVKNGISPSEDYTKDFQIIVLSGETGVASVFVDGVTGVIEKTKISAVLPAGTDFGTLTADKIKITPKDENASVSKPITLDEGKTWTFTVTAVDQSIQEYTLHLSKTSSNTGGGGGGGGGMKPSVNPPTSPEEAKNPIQVTIGEAGANIELSSESLDKIADYENPEDFIIDVSKSEAPVNQVNIAGDALEKISALANKNGISGFGVSMKNGDVVFDTKTLDSLTKEAHGKNMNLSMEVKQVADLTKQQQQMLGKDGNHAIILDLNILVGDTKVLNLGGEVTVHVPYTRKAGETPESIVVWYLGEAGTIEPCKGVYDETTKKYTFKTNHFSEYVLTTFPFTDVKQDSWYYGNVAYIYGNHLMSGVDKTTFAPEESTSRAMLVTVLWRMAGSPVGNGSNPFTDVSLDTWYGEAVLWANQEGIVSGFGDGMFLPNDTITREQEAKILFGYAKAQTPDGGNAMGKFIDTAQVSDWAAESVNWCVANGIIGGVTENTIVPQGSATRAQIAAILQRFASNIK